MKEKTMKEKTITRTIESTKAVVTVFDVKNNKMFSIDRNFSGKVTAEEALKTCRKEETEEIKVVYVSNLESVSKLYGMKESVFIAKGIILDGRAAKIDGEKIITRSIESTIVTFKAFDVRKMEMKTSTEYFSGKVTAETALKTLRDMESEELKIVMVEKVESDVKLYAIKETDFLDYAFELPPRTTEEKEEEA